MNWNEPIIKDISTSELIYYEESNKEICSKICSLIEIEIFPDVDQKHYWQKGNNGWANLKIQIDQFVNPMSLVFDTDVLRKICEAPSNILFASDNKFLNGIIHFNDYDSYKVYESLYRNFYVFETNLREYLISSGLTKKDLLSHFEYKLKRAKSEGLKIKFQKRIRDLKENESKYSKLECFQQLDFSEILNFSVSSSLGSKKHEIGLVTFKKKLDDIRDLRNIIMHSKDFVGRVKQNFHDLNTFKSFVSQVNLFKEIFSGLKHLVEEKKATMLKLKNIRKLQYLSLMDDSEIVNYFIEKH